MILCVDHIIIISQRRRIAVYRERVKLYILGTFAIVYTQSHTIIFFNTYYILMYMLSYNIPTYSIYAFYINVSNVLMCLITIEIQNKCLLSIFVKSAKTELPTYYLLCFFTF
jgi:hypothetical protein